ncbi:MAG: glycosyltransferase family 2 protein [Candidatus Moranbacteria bacterium]|nr:glycosyltransferase family 2 protein [Candidatus Moranbacteria bacterium]
MSKLTNRKKIVVLVLGFRALSFIKKGYLASIIKAADKIKNAKVDIVYLDNYSRDGSVPYIMKNYKNIDLLSATENYFYCKGVNVGLQFSYQKYRPDYFMLVDADNPCEESAYGKLIDFANKNAKVGIVQPLVKGLSDSNRVYSCGHVYENGISCRPLREIPKNKKILLNLQSCSISSTLVKTKVFEKCGLLDPIFKIYYESSDLSFRARKAGFLCACHVEAVCFNEGAKVSKTDNFHEGYFRNRNNLIFWKKHDNEKYEILKKIYQERHKQLNVKLANLKYVTDMEEESERRGIEDGIKITKKMVAGIKNEERIDKFDKTDAIVIQEACKNNEK